MKAAKMLFVSLTIALMSIVVCSFILDYNSISTLAVWVMYSVITLLIVGFIALMLYSLFYREVIKSLILRLRRKGI